MYHKCLADRFFVTSAQAAQAAWKVEELEFLGRIGARENI